MMTIKEFASLGGKASREAGVTEAQRAARRKNAAKATAARLRKLKKTKRK